MHASMRTALSAATLMTLVLALAPWEPAAARPAAPDPDTAVTQRPLTHLSTDKPIYRPGERLYLRGVLLDAITHRPVSAGQAWPVIEIKGPQGDTVTTGGSNVESSAFGFAWDVPAGQAGGEYTIRVSYPNNGYTPAERRFEVRAYRLPRLKSDIVFLREGYGPGDTVVATAHVDRAEGGVPAGAAVTAIARLDGREVFRGATTISADGDCRVEFALPRDLGGGEGSLTLVIEDGGVVETAARTMPILLSRVDVEMFPEGGDLVAGVGNRVYFEARRPDGKPADVAGVILDDRGRAVAPFGTEHEGRGRFELTPQAGRGYVMRIDEPAGITETVPVPPAHDRGVVITSLTDVTPAGEPVRLRLASPVDQRCQLVLRHKSTQVAMAQVGLTGGRPVEVMLKPAADHDGVLVATVLDADGKPLAERLVFRASARQVFVEIEPSRATYVPGDDVELTVRTVDERGRPVGATVGVTVTDDSLLSMIEPRERAPRLPVMVMLESDVRELADAHVYLDPANPDAPRATDLLLGTQGWRRFAFMDAETFVKTHGDAGKRVVAWLSPPVPRRRQPMAMRGGVGGAVVNEIMIVDKAEVLHVAAAPPPAAPADRREAQLDGEVVAGLRIAAKRIDRDALGDELWFEAGQANMQLAVREYAHQVRAGRQPGERIDFTETLYFNAGLATDPKTGEAKVAFGLSDSVTSFHVAADAYTTTGALGEGSALIESVEPFYIEPKMPLEVTAGDVITLPIAMVNATGDRLLDTVVTVTMPAGAGTVALEAPALAEHTRARLLHEIDTATLAGIHELTIAANASPYADTVTRPLAVMPRGFPVELAWGGLLDGDAAARHQVVMPESIAPGSVVATGRLYPTPLASLTDAMKRLIREPYGCFEQTSSTTYPLVMAQQYFLSHQGIDVADIERSRELLAKGYERLIGFQTDDRGYEWFGENPGHEALSAYGLLEFTDMAAVREVDASMLAGVRKYLLSARDGQGGFSRARRALHTWITDPDCSNGYILFALLSTGGPGDAETLEREIANFEDSATRSDNAYVTALAANVMALAGRDDTARDFRNRLARAQARDGFVDGARTSIVGSGGEALQIETTALAVLAWLGDSSHAGNVERAMRWLCEACKAGRFGSTQSTVLALRAIVEYDKSRARPKTPGSVQAFVDGRPVGEPIAFDGQTQGAIELPDLAGRLGPGRHAIELRMTGGSSMPYALAVEYHTDRPPSDDGCALDLDVKLRDTSITEGVSTEAAVTVTNRSDSVVPSPVAIVGIPGGLEVRHDRLRELVKAGTIAAYEVRGREVVLYWRSLDAGQRVDVALDLVGAVPGRYTAPASRAYLYYTDELKTWTGGLDVAIEARMTAGDQAATRVMTQ